MCAKWQRSSLLLGMLLAGRQTWQADRHIACLQQARLPHTHPPACPRSTPETQALGKTPSWQSVLWACASRYGCFGY